MKNLETQGFDIIEGVYSEQELEEILALVKEKELECQFGLRAFLVEHPDIAEKVLNENLIKLVKTIAPNCKQLIKSIYFDKPPTANWIVNWHQDLTLNLRNKKEVEGFKNWRVKGGRTVVQASLAILERIFTIRIHLDDCTKENGALRVIEQSHKKGIIDIQQWARDKKGKESICEVKKGGVVLMKPLTLHASRRTENKAHRRVIHLEFIDRALPNGLQWQEGIIIE